jgi:hypothetical protein
MFEFWTSEYDYQNNTEGCKIGETPKIQAYGMHTYLDSANQKVFISSDENKLFTWGFKTEDNQSGAIYPERVTVEFTITSGGAPKTTTTVMRSNANYDMDGFTIVTTNLEGRLSEGVNEIDINIVGEETKLRASIKTEISVVHFELKDSTQFEGNIKNNLELAPVIICTNGQDYFVEYKLNGGEYSADKYYTKGNGAQQNPKILVDISDLNDGKHICEYRGGILVNGSYYYSKTQRIEFVKDIRESMEKPQVLIFSEYASDEKIEENGNLIVNGIQQYIPYSIKYNVYTSDGRNAKVTFKNLVDGSEFDTNTDSSKSYTLDGQSIEFGLVPIEVYVNDEYNRTFYFATSNSSFRTINTNLIRSSINCLCTSK